MAKSILILGGSGGAGLPCARWLLRETDCAVTIAGRDVERAVTTATRLNDEFPGGRASACRAEAASAETLASAFETPDFVLVCSPTAPHARTVARAALAAGIDYMDIQYTSAVVGVLRELEPEIKAAGRCFITQGGCHPGLPAALVRYAGRQFSALRKAAVGLAMNVPNIGTVDAVAELAGDMARTVPVLFRGGRWERAGRRDTRTMDFGQDFGPRPCVPLDLEELHSLPAELGLQELGLYAAGFSRFADGVVFPFLRGVTGLLDGLHRGWGSRTSARLLRWGIHRFSQPPYGIVFKLEAEGERNGETRALTLLARHVDAYEMAAIPAVACLRQVLDGSIAQPGVWLMGQAVDPVRLLKDMERMGVRFDITETF